MLNCGPFIIPASFNPGKDAENPLIFTSLKTMAYLISTMGYEGGDRQPGNHDHRMN